MPALIVKSLSVRRGTGAWRGWVVRVKETHVYIREGRLDPRLCISATMSAFLRFETTSVPAITCAQPFSRGAFFSYDKPVLGGLAGEGGNGFNLRPK